MGIEVTIYIGFKKIYYKGSDVSLDRLVGLIRIKELHKDF